MIVTMIRLNNNLFNNNPIEITIFDLFCIVDQLTKELYQILNVVVSPVN